MSNVMQEIFDEVEEISNKYPDCEPIAVRRYIIRVLRELNNAENALIAYKGDVETLIKDLESVRQLQGCLNQVKTGLERFKKIAMESHEKLYQTAQGKQMLPLYLEEWEQEDQPQSETPSSSPKPAEVTQADQLPPHSQKPKPKAATPEPKLKEVALPTQAHKAEDDSELSPNEGKPHVPPVDAQGRSHLDLIKAGNFKLKKVEKKQKKPVVHESPSKAKKKVHLTLKKPLNEKEEAWIDLLKQFNYRDVKREIENEIKNNNDLQAKERKLSECVNERCDLWAGLVKSIQDFFYNDGEKIENGEKPIGFKEWKPVEKISLDEIKKHESKLDSAEKALEESEKKAIDDILRKEGVLYDIIKQSVYDDVRKSYEGDVKTFLGLLKENPSEMWAVKEYIAETDDCIYEVSFTRTENMQDLKKDFASVQNDTIYFGKQRIEIAKKKYEEEKESISKQLEVAKPEDKKTLSVEEFASELEKRREHMAYNNSDEYSDEEEESSSSDWDN